MSDVYVECLVQAKGSKSTKIFQVVLIILTVLCCLAMVIFPPIVVVAVLLGVASYFVGTFTQVEYEYLYLDKELTIDRIIAQSRRKKVATYSIDRMEIFAPENSYHLDNYKKRDVKTEDYSAAEAEVRYCMYYEGGAKVILSPTEDMVKALKNVAPRKVFND
ncbi:MAG: hypothetical protein E7292_11100 [Lachnospiraceae bacterium]|nr:hypothetical protein [Lachnospiraceae bacterium]